MKPDRTGNDLCIKKKETNKHLKSPTGERVGQLFYENLELGSRLAQKLFGSCRVPVTLLAAEPVFRWERVRYNLGRRKTKNHFKEKEAQSEHVTRGLSGVGPLHLLLPPVGGISGLECSREREEVGRRWEGRTGCGRCGHEHAGTPVKRGRKPSVSDSATALWL